MLYQNFLLGFFPSLIPARMLPELLLKKRIKPKITPALQLCKQSTHHEKSGTHLDLHLNFIEGPVKSREHFCPLHHIFPYEEQLQQSFLPHLATTQKHKSVLRIAILKQHNSVATKGNKDTYTLRKTQTSQFSSSAYKQTADRNCS